MVVTCGGAAPALLAVAEVVSGITVGLTTAEVVTASVFVGSSMLGGALAFDAMANSTTVKEFNDRGNWWTVAWTVGGGILGGFLGWSASRQPSSKAAGNPNSTGSVGYHAPAGGGGVTNIIQTRNGTVTFGHGGNHFLGTDVSAIEQSIANNVPILGIGQNYTGVVNVNGIDIIYRAFGRDNGVINVGTYFIK